MRTDIAIIGGGILGTSLVYFLLQLTQMKIAVIAQAPEVGSSLRQ